MKKLLFCIGLLGLSIFGACEFEDVEPKDETKPQTEQKKDVPDSE